MTLNLIPRAAAAQYWLVKTEPDSFSIADLAAAPEQTIGWDGVRNYQARNFLRTMKRGERVLFYHSSADPTAIVGIARVVREAYPDETAWDPADHHFDPASTPENPRWFKVDLKLVRELKRPLTLPELRKISALKQMELLRQGSRLSVQPVSRLEFETILKLADRSPAGKRGKS